MWGLELTTEPELIYSVRSQDTGFPWGVGTRRGRRKAGDVLFLDLDAGCLGVLFVKSHELYTYNFCTFYMYIVFRENTF